jgi:hypothetical protein
MNWVFGVFKVIDNKVVDLRIRDTVMLFIPAPCRREVEVNLQQKSEIGIKECNRNTP